MKEAMQSEMMHNEESEVSRLRKGARSLIEAHKSGAVSFAEKVAAEYPDVDAIPNATREEFENMTGFQPEMLDALVLEIGSGNATH